MTKEAYNESIIKSGMSATFDVLNRPKNLAKPPMCEDIEELFFLAKGEMNELDLEVWRNNVYADGYDYEQTRAEAADTIAYLCALIHECDRRLSDAP